MTTASRGMSEGLFNSIVGSLNKEVGTFVGVFLFYLFVRVTHLSRGWLKRNSVTHQSKQAIQIQELMLKLRLKVDADRVGVLQFMNGAHFLNRVSKYNLMCTHQSVKAGIAHISLRTDESVLTQFPLFMKRMLAGECVKFDIADIPDPVMKAALMRQGVTCMAASPFFSKGGDIEGFLIVDHVQEKPSDLCIEHCARIEDASLQIGYELRK